ncbi:hypothetical protein I5M32_16440 [Pedobacter sp. SD-b]|uniref:Uncharacterized protein n=1 Tax=Pedobacter segetis TaxID=2793069 RepID=A0ABS1BNV4_9SPHI|nr:hypothetical protein [Pedobacter segetis]MBK0384550.1 hypothetical protein [Pedobacter segetis]
MKKYIFLVIIIIFSFTSFSQSKRWQVELTNTQLKNKIEDYALYVKTWASQNQMSDYIVALEQQNTGDNSVFILSTLLSSKSIDRFKPSVYTVINDCPVIIRTGLQSYTKADTVLIKFLKDKYWKGTAEALIKTNRKIQEDAINETLKNSKDSVTIFDNGIAKKVLESEFRVRIGGTTGSTINIEPKSWILFFKGQFLERETEDRFEYKTQ